MFEMFQCMLVLVSRKLPVSRQLQHRLHMSSLIIESQTVEMFESPNPIISVLSESEINFRKLKLFFAIIFIYSNKAMCPVLPCYHVRHICLSHMFITHVHHTCLLHKLVKQVGHTCSIHMFVTQTHVEISILI